MKIKSIITAAILSIALATSGIAGAQSSTQKAQAHYFTALEAFDSGDYQGALDGVQKAEAISGKTGDVLLKLETKALFRLGRYQEAKSTLNELYSSGPSDQSKREMASILVEIDEKIEEERRREEKQRNDKAEQLRRDKLLAEEARLKADRQRSIQATLKREAGTSLQRLLACDSGEKCLEIATELNSYTAAKASENLDVRKVHKYYSRGNGGKIDHQIRARLIKRSCEVYNYDDGCLAYVGQWVYPNAKELVSKLCEENHPKACFIKGYGLAGLHLYGYQLSKFNNRYITAKGAFLFEEKAKSLEDPRYDSYWTNDSKKILLKDGFPYIIKSCELDYLVACAIIATEPKSNKSVSKKLRNKSKRKVCKLDPDSTFFDGGLTIERLCD